MRTHLSIAYSSWWYLDGPQERRGSRVLWSAVKQLQYLTEDTGLWYESPSSQWKWIRKSVRERSWSQKDQLEIAIRKLGFSIFCILCLYLFLRRHIGVSNSLQSFKFEILMVRSAWLLFVLFYYYFTPLYLCNWLCIYELEVHSLWFLGRARPASWCTMADITCKHRFFFELLLTDLAPVSSRGSGLWNKMWDFPLPGADKWLYYIYNTVLVMSYAKQVDQTKPRQRTNQPSEKDFNKLQQHVLYQ